MLVTGMFLISEAATGDSGLGLITDLIGDGLMKKFFGKSVVSTTGGALATTATTTAGGTAATTVGGGTAATGGTATALGSNPAGWIISAGLLASGLGEGLFQIKKASQKKEADSYKRFKDKGWWNPAKYFWGAVHLGDKFTSTFFGTFGVILDILGTPFRE